MAEPSKERIAAALALAEAASEWANIQEPPAGSRRVRCWIERMQPALTAYRATAPKLRTRAEVDAERLLNLDAWRRNAIDEPTLRFRDERLAREETAPEAEPDSPHPTGRCSCGGQDRCDWCQSECAGCSYKRMACQCEPLPDPEPCGCEETDALRRELHELKFRQETIHRIASQDRPVTGVELGRIAKLSLP